MHKSELRANLALINHVIMVNDLKAGTIVTHRGTGCFEIQIWSWFNIPLKRIKYTPIPYVNNNKTKFGYVTYYPLHADSPWNQYVI